jgi:transcription elongation GreA/GreB family factor
MSGRSFLVAIPLHVFPVELLPVSMPNNDGSFSMNEDKRHQAATIGSLVKIRERGEDEEEVYRLGNVTRPLSNELAPDNPMGSALIGAAPGDQITVKGPAGAIEFEVLEVRQAESA